MRHAQELQAEGLWTLLGSSVSISPEVSRGQPRGFPEIIRGPGGGVGRGSRGHRTVPRSFGPSFQVHLRPPRGHPRGLSKSLRDPEEVLGVCVCGGTSRRVKELRALPGPAVLVSSGASWGCPEFFRSPRLEGHQLTPTLEQNNPSPLGGLGSPLWDLPTV